MLKELKRKKKPHQCQTKQRALCCSTIHVQPDAIQNFCEGEICLLVNKLLRNTNDNTWKNTFIIIIIK